MAEPKTADDQERSSDEPVLPERSSDEPVLPERSSDDSDRGWGERDVELDGSHGDDDDERLIREKPPHW